MQTQHEPVTDGVTTEAPTTTEVAKTSIRPDTSKMVKTSSGSYHKPDFIGETLNGLTVEQVKEIAVAVGVDHSKYAHLNPGQIRMTLGNKLRAMTTQVEEKGDAEREKNIAIEKVADKVTEMANEFKEANAAAKVAEAKAKAAAREAKAALAKSANTVAENAAAKTLEAAAPKTLEAVAAEAAAPGGKKYKK